MNELDLYSQPNYSDTVKLYHVSDDSKERLLKFKFREKPTDTAKFFHNLINVFSKKKFNLPIRNLFFTYAKPLSKTALRAIPLGNNVRFFYHPTIEDLTTFIFVDMKGRLEELIHDIIDQHEFNLEVDDTANDIFDILENNTSLTKIKDLISSKFDDVSDNSNALSDRILKFVIDYIQVYVADVVEVDHVEDIPPDTESEIMIYAPDDIYLQSQK